MTAPTSMNQKTSICPWAQPTPSIQKQVIDFFYAQDTATKITILFAAAVGACSLLNKTFILTAVGAYVGTRIALAQQETPKPWPCL